MAAQNYPNITKKTIKEKKQNNKTANNLNKIAKYLLKFAKYNKRNAF